MPESQTRSREKQRAGINFSKVLGTGISTGLNIAAVIGISTTALVEASSQSQKPLLPVEAREFVYHSVMPYAYTLNNSTHSLQKIFGDARVLKGTLNTLRERALLWHQNKAHALSAQLSDKVRTAESSVRLKRLAGENSSMQDRELQQARNDFENGARRLDAWRLYLRLEQKSGTFSQSTWRPERSVEGTTYYRINNFFEKLWLSTEITVDTSDRNILFKPSIGHSIGASSQAKDVTSISDQTMTIKHLVSLMGESGVNQVFAADEGAGIMGRFRIMRGKDSYGTYISYYDKWDLKESPEGKSGIVGKPFEIYDRLYYDPVTFSPLSPQSR